MRSGVAENILGLFGPTPLLHPARFCLPPRTAKKISPQGLRVPVEPRGSAFGAGEAGARRAEGAGQSQLIPPVFARALCGEIIMITDDEAFSTVAPAGRPEGVPCGGSAQADASSRPSPTVQSVT